MLRISKGKSHFLLPLILTFLTLAILALPYAIDLLIADEALTPAPDSPPRYMTAVTAEDLAGKTLLDAGWVCGKEGRQCVHVLINQSAFLLCLPAEYKDGCLMIPLAHFRLIAGCGLETAPDGKTRLIKHDKAFQLTQDGSYLTCENESWIFPRAPYMSHGALYVPLRFLCETLDLPILWHSAGHLVLLESPWVDAQALAEPMKAINETLLAALRTESESAEEAGASAPTEAATEAASFQEAALTGDPVKITVTFYFSSKSPAWTASGQSAAAGSIAADADIPFGTQLYIPDLDFIRKDGIFTVHDRGVSVTGNHIDVFIPNEIRREAEVSANLRRGKFTVTAWLLTGISSE